MIDPAAEEEISGYEDESACAQHKPCLARGESVRLDEERADEDECSCPRRVGEELSGRPPHHAWVREHRTKVNSRRCRRGGHPAGEDCQREK